MRRAPRQLHVRVFLRISRARAGAWAKGHVRFADFRWCTLRRMSASSDPHRDASPDRGERDYTALAAHIRQWGLELGFDEIGIADTNLASAEVRLLEWLA